MSFTALFVAFFLLIVLVITAGSLLYFVEGKSSSITSIPTGCWFALVTVSTVGYGRILPTTAVGRLICSVLIVSGVVYMAMPLTIIGSNFTEVWNHRDLFLVLEKIRVRFSAWGLDYNSVDWLFTMTVAKGRVGVDIMKFKHFLAVIRIEVPDNQVFSVFKAIDRDGDGLVSSEDFARFLFPAAHRKEKPHEIEDDDDDEEEDNDPRVVVKSRSLYFEVGRTANRQSNVQPGVINTALFQTRHQQLVASVDALGGKVGNLSDKLVTVNRRIAQLAGKFRRSHRSESCKATGAESLS